MFIPGLNAPNYAKILEAVITGLGIWINTNAILKLQKMVEKDQAFQFLGLMIVWAIVDQTYKQQLDYFCRKGWNWPGPN